MLALAIIAVVAVLAFGAGAALSRVLTVRLSISMQILLGYALWALTLLLSLRNLGAMHPASILLLPASLFGLWSARKSVRVTAVHWPAVVTIAAFLVCVGLVHRSFLFEGGSVFAVPDIFDTPKHILTLTALRSANSWPPASPLMEGMGFAYNFGFYALPAHLMSFVDDPSLGPQVYFWLIVFTAALAVLVVGELSEKLGTPRQFAIVVTACATWVGGFAPLLLKDPVPMGFRLYSEGLVSFPIWVDEPFVTSIFVPQHLFAAICGLGILALLGHAGGLTRRLILCVILGFAGSLSSLILLPHVSMILGLSVVVLVAIQGTHRRDAIGVAGVLAAYALLLLPFVLDAVRWQSGTSEGPLIALPPLDWTLPVIALAFGPVALLGVMAVPPIFAEKLTAVRLATLLSVVLVAIAAVTFRYAEAPFKGTLLLRLLFAALSGLGFALLWNWARAAIARAVIIAIMALAVVINLPVMSLLAKPTLTAYGPADSNFIGALRQQQAPILFDGVIDQWLVALTGRPTYADYRPIRADAYLPPEDRERYAEIFADTEQGRAERAKLPFGSVVAGPARAAYWQERLGPPVATGFGLQLFTR